jgi:hypothetical protein
MLKLRNLCLFLLAVTIAASGLSCRGIPNQSKINKALERIDAALPTMAEQPWEILLDIHGGGLFAKVRDISSDNQIDAVAYLTAQAGAQGWSVMRDDMFLPRILSQARGITVEQHPNMFLGIMLHAGADPIQQYITTATGESPELRSFVSSMLVDLDPRDLSGSQYVPGPDGNAMGWTLLALADAGLTEANWEMGPAGRLNISNILPLVLDRPLNWGPTAGLDEHFGLARCVYVHRTAQAKDGKNPFDAKLTGIWTNAAARLDTVAAAIKKNRRKDNTLDASWSGAGPRSDAPAVRARHTARALAILCMTLPDKQLRESWISDTVSALTDLVTKDFDSVSKDPYAMAYSAHALRLYRDRLENKKPRMPKICGPEDCPYSRMRP